MVSAVIAVFDGHNDALTRDDADDFAAGRRGGHLDVPRARAGGFGGGMFAAFARGERGVSRRAAAKVVERTFARLDALARDGHARVVLAAGDVDAARDARVLAAVKH